MDELMAAITDFTHYDRENLRCERLVTKFLETLPNVGIGIRNSSVGVH